MLKIGQEWKKEIEFHTDLPSLFPARICWDKMCQKKKTLCNAGAANTLPKPTLTATRPFTMCQSCRVKFSKIHGSSPFKVSCTQHTVNIKTTTDKYSGMHTGLWFHFNTGFLILLMTAVYRLAVCFLSVRLVSFSAEMVAVKDHTGAFLQNISALVFFSVQIWHCFKEYNTF